MGPQESVAPGPFDVLTHARGPAPSGPGAKFRALTRAGDGADVTPAAPSVELTKTYGTGQAAVRTLDSVSVA